MKVSGHKESGADLMDRSGLMEALDYCYRGNSDYDIVWDRIRKEINRKLIVSWNDKPDRTFAEVKALVEKLDI